MNLKVYLVHLSGVLVYRCAQHELKAVGSKKGYFYHWRNIWSVLKVQAGLKWSLLEWSVSSSVSHTVILLLLLADATLPHAYTGNPVSGSAHCVCEWTLAQCELVLMLWADQTGSCDLHSPALGRTVLLHSDFCVCVCVCSARITL